MNRILSVSLMIIVVLIVAFMIYVNSNGEPLTIESCESAGGIVINRLDFPEGCGTFEKIGDVDDLRCPCVCCKAN